MNFLKIKEKIKKMPDIIAARLFSGLVKIFTGIKPECFSKLSVLGLLFYYLIPIRKKMLAESIDKTGIFPDTAVRETAIKGIYSTQVLNLLEFLWGANLMKTENIHKYYRIHGLSHLKKAISGQEGGVIISSHLGNWETLAIIVGRLGIKMAPLVVSRDYEIHKAVDKHRSMSGNKPFDRNHVAIKLIRLIKKNEFAGIVADQHTDNSGVKTTFFNIPCMSTALPSVLSLKLNTPIYGIFMIRSKDNMTHDIYIEPPVYARDFKTGEDKDETIAACTQALNDMIEKYIRMAPEQWFWFHKRWRVEE